MNANIDTNKFQNLQWSVAINKLKELTKLQASGSLDKYWSRVVAKECDRVHSSDCATTFNSGKTSHY